MKLANPITWGFDPDHSNLPVLANPTARKVWSAIKAGHLVDQYFNDACLEFAKAFDRAQPNSTEDLIKLATRHRLHYYGNSMETRQPDTEWWGDLLAWLRGELTIEQITPASETPNAELTGPRVGHRSDE